MRRQILSLVLMLGGAFLLVIGFVITPAPTHVAAGPVLQPSPRPPIPPTDEPGGGWPPTPTPIPYGRITGTVIDLRTGAPAPNRLVVVGDSTVITDANGNYDRWVVSGDHRVYLQLRPGEGEAEQPPQIVTVGKWDTVVVHLFFTSPAPTAAPVPTVTPIPTATPEPTVPPQPTATVAPPPPLPTEPVAQAPAPTVAPRPVVVAAPATLPVTATGRHSLPVFLVLAGVVLLGVGVLLQIRPRRRAAQRREADQRMLRRLLATPPRRDDDSE